MQHKVDAGQCGGLERVGGFIGRLRIGQLGAAEAAAAAEGHAQPASQSTRGVYHHAGFRCAEGRCAGGHGDRRRKGAEDDRAARANQLCQGNPSHGFGKNLCDSARDGNR